MDQLPDEILLVIFDLIDDLRVAVGLERVCRRWRKLMLRFGWKLIRRIELILLKDNAHWIEPIGARCGAHVVTCCFYGVAIDCTMIRLVADHFPAIKHLEFRRCEFNGFDDASMLEPIRRLGTRVRSLTFFAMFYRSELDSHFLANFPCLRHLGLSLYPQPNGDVLSLPRHFSAELCSLFLSSSSMSSSDLEQLLAMVQRDSPKLAALYLDWYYNSHPEQFLSRISDLKNLRFLRLATDYDFICPESLCSCLNNLPQLHALQIILYTWLLPDVLPFFRGLVHLSISFSFDLEGFDSYELVGLQSIIAPQLRSLSLDILLDEDEMPSDLHFEIADKVLKIAANSSNLEYLNAPHGWFSSVEMICQLIQLCPNLHSFGTKLFYHQIFESDVDILWRVVAEQWRTGTRKHLPLRIWLYGVGGREDDRDYECPVISWQDSFLAIQSVQHGFMAPNPVLQALFRDEVFNVNDSGGSPSFAYYSRRT